MLGRIIGLVLVAVAVTATASAQDVKLPEIEFGRYHALVIGNNDYQHLRNLTTAVGDADAVATLLEEKYGFNVTKLTNATRLDITGALNRLRQTLTEKDNLLVYYAGMGSPTTSSPISRVFMSCSLSPGTPHSPTKTRLWTSARLDASWACSISSKAVRTRTSEPDPFETFQAILNARG